MAGEILKKRREDLGVDVREIADLLKIKADYLIAIESDSFDKLPPAVYTMGYIRCYAGYLKVDADPIIENYTKHVAQPATATVIPVGYSQKKMPKVFPIGVTIVVLAAVVYFLYPFLPERGGSRKEAVTTRMSNSTPAPKEPVVLPEEKATEITAPAATPQMETAAPQTQSGVDKLEKATGITVPTATPQMHTATPQTQAGEHKVTIAAVEKTWMLAQFSDGKKEEMLLQPGETKSWTFSETLRLRVGNAGGIKVNIDGQDMGVLGSSGQVTTLTLPQQ